MPNRILRDWTDSKKIEKLKWQEEVLFTRLIMKADDYGNFAGDPLLVKNLCFPRKDGLRVSDISAWLDNIQAAGLIRFYHANGDTFLHILEFRQRLDRAKRKFPNEPKNFTNDSLVIDNDSIPETKRIRNESESETETEGEKFFKDEKFLVPEMLKEWKKIFKNYPEKKETDFPALRQIAEFIADKQGIDCDIGIMPLFIQLAAYIHEHKFYKNYSLKQVSNHIQSIVQSINNESNSKNNGKSNNKDLRERVNQAFAKRHS